MSLKTGKKAPSANIVIIHAAICVHVCCLDKIGCFCCNEYKNIARFGCFCSYFGVKIEVFCFFLFILLIFFLFLLVGWKKGRTFAVHLRTNASAADFETLSFTNLKFYVMAKIALDGSNWASVVNSTLVEGSKLTFEDGFKCTVIEYYKAHFFRKGSKTALKIKYGNKTETIETDTLRKAHCPNYEPKKHETKQKAFSYQHLELATEMELVQLRDAILAELKRREDAKANKIAELEKELARLKAL